MTLPSRHQLESNHELDASDIAAQVSNSLNERQSDITAHMSELLSKIGSLNGEPDLRNLLEASVEASVKTIFHMISNKIPLAHIRPATAMVEYALRLAQRGISANSLIRAYHMGQDDLLGHFFTEAQGLDCDANTKLKVVQHVAEVMYQYIDWVCSHLLEVHEEERVRWATTSDNTHSQAIQKVLAGHGTAVADFEAETGYSLNQYHLAMVLRMPVAAPPHETVAAFKDFARDLASRSSYKAPPLLTLPDQTTAWIWFPRGRDHTSFAVDHLELLAAEFGVQASVGLPAYGPVGFKRTFEQAEATKDICHRGSGKVPVATFYGDESVAIASILARETERTRTWVREVLGPLAANTEAAARSRETLSVFLSTGGSYTQAAELLHLHRNSVRYRVDKAMDERGQALYGDRLDVELALRMCHLLNFMADED